MRRLHGEPPAAVVAERVSPQKIRGKAEKRPRVLRAYPGAVGPRAQNKRRTALVRNEHFEKSANLL